MGLPPANIMASQGTPASWFVQALNIPVEQVLVCNPAANDTLPAANEFDVAIITGSWAMVTDKLDWSELTANWAQQMVNRDKRLLGVCYGHQIMAYAMGGIVDYNPNGREQGTFNISVNEAGSKDELIGFMPKSFKAHLSHAQSVIKAPAGSQVLASNSHDANQIIRYGKNALSMQFHPEFTVNILSACMAGRKADAKGVFNEPEDLGAASLPAQLMRKFVFDL